jgi:DNA-directed RNA polymerase specialized sigma24 family protein
MPDCAVEAFEEHRGLLFGVAYRMLGSGDEAEDIVQETWLRWDRADRPQVTDPKACLVRIATRAALDQMRGGLASAGSASDVRRRRRHTVIGAQRLPSSVRGGHGT